MRNCYVDISKKQPGKSGLRHSMGIFATGVVYGCNPDALFCVIPAITLPTKLAAATYTAMFVLGTVGAMGGYTAFIGQPSHLLCLCCAVLCCAALRCAVLCCAVLCCAVLCCAVP